MPSLRKWLTFTITFLALSFFAYFAIKNFSEIPQIRWSSLSIMTALLCIGLVLINILIVATIWHLLLRDHEIFISWKQAQIIIFISQFAKYLPGNVVQHIGRVLMAKEIGIPVHITLNTMLVEILWGICLATGLAITSLLIFEESYAAVIDWQLNIYQLGIGVLFLLFTPWLGIGFINAYLPQLAERLTGNKKIASPKPGTALMVMLLFLLCFLILGLILKLQALWFFNVDEGHAFQFACLFSIAWLTGYLVPGAPGGLGVREAMMLLLLSPVVGPGAAVGLGITLRVTTTLGDALAFLLGLVLNRAKTTQTD